MTRSTQRDRLRRIYWKNVQVSFCIKCQLSYPWKKEYCNNCGDKLVPKVYHVEAKDH